MVAISLRQVCINKIDTLKKNLLEESKNSSKAETEKKLKKVYALDILKNKIINNSKFNKKSLLKFRKKHPELDKGLCKSRTTKMLNELSESSYFSKDKWPQDRNPLFPKVIIEKVSQFISLSDLNSFLQIQRRGQLSKPYVRDITEKKFSEELIPFLKISTQGMKPAEIILAFKNFSNLKDPELLFKSIIERKIEVVKLFIRAGAIDGLNSEDCTVLHCTTQGHCADLDIFTEMVKLLLPCVSHNTVSAQNKLGLTVLHLVAKRGFKEIIVLLASHPICGKVL